MVATLILVLVLAMLAGSMSMIAVGNSVAVQGSLSYAAALTVTEIGVERAKAAIVSGALDEQFAAEGHQASESGTIYTPTHEVYGSFAYHVTANHAGIAGDYLIVSQGTAGQNTRQISVVLRHAAPEVPNASAAVTLYNPTRLASFTVTPPVVCGLDTAIPTKDEFSSLKASKLDPGSGDGPHAVGIGVHDDDSVVNIVSALGKKISHVTGVAENGDTESASVYNVGAGNPSRRIDVLNAADVAELIEEYEAVADTVYDPSSQSNVRMSLNDGPDLGTREEPRVVVLRSTSGEPVSLSSKISGAGVLIVDAPVQFGKTFNYAGLIIMTGRAVSPDTKVNCRSLLLGALIAVNNNANVQAGVDLASGDRSESGLHLRDTINVFYSRDGLGCAQRALGRYPKFRTLFYAEQQPDPESILIADDADGQTSDDGQEDDYNAYATYRTYLTPPW